MVERDEYKEMRFMNENQYNKEILYRKWERTIMSEEIYHLETCTFRLKIIYIYFTNTHDMNS